MDHYVWGFAISFLWTILAVPLIKRVALHFKVLDVPNFRKVHSASIPRLGGVAIYFGIFLAWITLGWSLPKVQDLIGGRLSEIAWLVSGATLLCGIGIIDDWRGLNARWKLPFQILAGVLAFWGGFQFNLFNHADPVSAVGVWADMVVTVFWITAVANAMNMIDGLDGLASGISTLAFLTLGIISYTNGHTTIALLAVAIAGSTAGFLVYNVHPAKIFLGDSGSLLLGYLLASLSIRGAQQESLFFSLAIVLFLLFVPLLDITLAVLRRFLRGRAIFRADRDHLHHRLLQQGIGYSRSVMMLWSMAFVFGVVALLLNFTAKNNETNLMAFLFTGALFGLTVQRFGFTEIRDLVNAIRNGNQRRQPPRSKNLAVRRTVKQLTGMKDLETLNRNLDSLTIDLELDLLRIEVTLNQHGKTWKTESVHFNRLPEQLSSPGKNNGNGHGPDLPLCKTVAFFKKRSGICGSVVLGKESWKVRRKSEDDEIWASLLADGLSQWVEAKRDWLILLPSDKKLTSAVGRPFSRVGPGLEN